MSDDEFNGVLKRLYEDSSQVQEQYPKLLIREKKNNVVGATFFMFI